MFCFNKACFGIKFNQHSNNWFQQVKIVTNEFNNYQNFNISPIKINKALNTCQQSSNLPTMTKVNKH